MRENQIKKTLIKIIVFPLSVLIFGLLGFLLLSAVYCIPTNSMEKKLEESAVILERERTYPRPMLDEGSQLDNFTDSIMLNTAGHPNGSDNVFVASLKSGNYSSKKSNPVETFVYRYKEKGTDIYDSYYPRYWHGYLLFLKPLLVFFNLGNIRYILMFVQLGLFALIVAKLATKEKRLIIPVFLTWLFLNPVSTMLSLQFSSVTIITMLSMLFMLFLFERWGCNQSFRWAAFFLLIGSLTSYFDFLTFPLISLGVPLVLFMGLMISEMNSVKILSGILKILIMSLSWLFGYAGMWFMKWAIGSMITGENIFKNAFEQLTFRTSSDVDDKPINVLDVFQNQFSVTFKRLWIAIVIALLVVFVIFLIRYKRFNIDLLIINIVIGAFPFAWYALLKNHSYIHAFFTYREIAITVFAFSSFIALHKLRNIKHGA